jgi:hypothetical protein
MKYFRLLVWLMLSLMASSNAMAQPGQSQILGLSKEDRTELQGRLDWVRSLIHKRYGLTISLRKSADLVVLQRIVDERVIAQRDVFSQQSLGLAFGNTVVYGLGYHWVKVVDELGTDFAMQFRDTSIIGFPLTSISKRVEQGKKVDLKGLYDFYARSRSIHSAPQTR